MFAEFMEDSTGVEMLSHIGVDNLLWGNDFPHAESTWPQSPQFLDRIFNEAGTDVRRKITRDNAIKLFKFDEN